MSNNILKGNYIVLDNEEKVIIDNNEAVERALAELAARLKEEVSSEELEEGFVEGLDAVQVARLVSDDQEAEADPEQMAEEHARRMEEAEAEIEQMKADAADEIERMKAEASERGYREGYDKGQQEAESECKAHYRDLEQKLVQKERDLQRKYDEQLEALEPTLVDKLTEVYEHVLGIRLDEEKENILFLINRSFSTMDGGRNYLIHISKDEYETVKAQKQAISVETGMPEDAFEIIADGTMKKGDCLIESDTGIMDCGLGTQMELLKRQLKVLSFS